MSEIKNLVCKVTVFHWYGVRFTDVAGKSIKLTPQVGTVVSAGRISMPAGLNGDDTYGVDIDLPGVAAIPEANISVLVIPTRPAISAISSQYITGGLFYYNTMYANSAASYYSRNDANGVMSAWSAGARTAGDKTTWNPILAVSPVAFWDKMGATTFTSIRLFAASVYMLRQSYTDINYSLTGTASGNANFNSGGDPTTTPKDANELTFSGAGAAKGPLDPAGQEDAYESYIQILFASCMISRAEICMGLQAEASGSGSHAEGNWAIQLYYSSAWHDIITGSFSHNVFIDNVTYNQTGAWGGCTGIRFRGYVHCQKGQVPATGKWAQATCICRELRAFGEPDTEPKNILKYQVGSAIIPSVDYVISVKEWNF